MPEPLKPWVEWALHGEEQKTCPFTYNHVDQRHCAWPSHVQLDLNKRQGQFERLAKSLNVWSQVHFLGQRDDIPSLLFASNILLHPAYLENTGNVIVEALVAGVPVLCSGTCGYADYVSDNNLGQVVEEPFSQAEMTDKLVALLKSKRDWKKECECSKIIIS